MTPASDSPATLPASPSSASLPASRTELCDRLDDAARTWLREALAEAGHAAGQRTAPDFAEPADRPAPASARQLAWELRFVSAGRHCGAAHADAVRVLLLGAAQPGPGTLIRLYRYGDAAERRAVLLALPSLLSGPEAVPLVEDALRTHDTRLVAAAVGPYGATHLDARSWRHAVLKCLFSGVPLDVVHNLASRAHGDSELARMLVDFAAERTAAGRSVPGDLHRLLALTVRPKDS